MPWLKQSAKAFLNSTFDRLNPCSARGIALSQLDVLTILICLIICLVTGRASSFGFDRSCCSSAFSNFALFVRVFCSSLSGIVLPCAI